MWPEITGGQTEEKAGKHPPRPGSAPALTHLVLVAGVAGQVADEAGEGAQLVVVGGADAVQHGVQDALLLQRQPAQHARPLQGKHPLGGSAGSLLLPLTGSRSG